MKRKPFQDEHEFRVLYECKDELLRVKPVQIDLGSILKITLSPWLNESVAKSVVKIIRRLDRCSAIDVRPSSLLERVLKMVIGLCT